MSCRNARALDTTRYRIRFNSENNVKVAMRFLAPTLSSSARLVLSCLVSSRLVSLRAHARVARRALARRARPEKMHTSYWAMVIAHGDRRCLDLRSTSRVAIDDVSICDRRRELRSTLCRVRGRAAEPPPLAKRLNLGGPRDELSAQQQPENERATWPGDATAASAKELRLRILHISIDVSAAN
jgi:hypothetical protein